MAAQPTQVATLWTVDEYLDLERHSTVRHEYHRGYVYAMAGGTQGHNTIAVNVVSLVREAGRRRGCRAFTSDMKVRQSPEDYVYADVSVTCDPRDNVPSQDWIAFPSLVVEVLSPKTEGYDRGDKFDGYRGIPSLREYVLIQQRRRAIEVWRRDDAGEWSRTAYGPDDAIPLRTLDLALTMDQVYEDSGL